MFYQITNFIKNYFSNFYSELETIFLNNGKDFIEELTMEGCQCYLTGNSLCSKLLNFKFSSSDELIDRDIYINNIHPMELMRILIKYGDVYVYGVKNYNFKKSNKNIRFLLIPFVGISSYEFTYNHNYGATINSFIYKINSIKDIDNIDYQTILNTPSMNYMMDEIKERIWHNVDEKNYFKSFENIMRCFNLCSYYNLKLEETSISYIKKNVQNYIKNNIKYNSDIVYSELLKILYTYSNFKILNIIHDTRCLELMNMKFVNFSSTLEKINNFDTDSDCNHNDYNIIKFLILLDGLETNSVKRWCISNNINKVKNITNNIKKYYILFDHFDQYLKINTKYDILIFLTKINHIINRGNETDFFRENILKTFDYFIKNIKNISYDKEKIDVLLQECKQYPISLKDINISDKIIHEVYNVKWNELKNVKKSILEKIHKDELQNNCISLCNYFEKMN